MIALIKTFKYRGLSLIITLILRGGNHNMCLNIMVEVKCQVGRGANVCVLAISMNIAAVFESITELTYRTPRVLVFILIKTKTKKQKSKVKIKYEMCLQI